MESTRTVRFSFLVLSAALLAACATPAPELATTEAALLGVARSSPGLDFEYYRTRIEPIFLKARAPDEGAGRACASCHTRVATRLRLQPLTPGATAWTEEQSRQNLQFVSTLVTPGNPLDSRLLLHPLAAEAGGDPSHTGGKFWQSQEHPEWNTIAEWVRGGGGPGGTPATTVASALTPQLDYEYFKTQVQSVFLKKRPGLARCYSCHGQGAGEGSARRAMPFQPLSPGATTWNEEQSRRNFEVVSQKVVPGAPNASRLLLHPLRFEAGGDLDHMGGAHFESPNDPDWQLLATWVNGGELLAR
jgi:cytochrome c553